MAARRRLTAEERRRISGTPKDPDGRGRYPGVYFVRFGDYIKVGSAANVVKRVKYLFANAPGCVLEPLGWIRVRGTNHTSRGTYYHWDHEAQIHTVLAPYGVQGEWYRDCPTVRRFVARYAQSWPETP